MILVTGANGFVGSHVARLLVKRGEHICCFVRKTGNLVNLQSDEFKGKLEFVYGDLRDYDSVKRAVKSAEIVYHLGAYVHLWYSSPKSVYDINWKGSRTSFRRASRKGSRRSCIPAPRLS